MMPLLQFGGATFWKPDTPGDSSVIWVYVIVGGIVALLVWAVLSQRAQGPSGPAFNRGGFRRAARAIGLAEEELRFLEPFARALGLSSPETALRNKARLDAFFKDVYRSIEKNSDSESSAEERKAYLFEIRERLARRSSQGVQVRSTRQLGRNTPISFITPEAENYPTVVVFSEDSGLAVEPVIDPLGSPIRFRRGTKLSCFFYTKAHQGYQFGSRVLGFRRYEDRELMILGHNDAVSALPSRQFQRRATKVSCMYYRVAVAPKRGKGGAQAAARVENFAFPGIVTDLSAGGMAVQAATPLAVGDFVKIVLDPGSSKQTAFGKVLRVNRLRGSGGVMHVQFVKISRKSLNSILSYVFGYAE